MGALEHKMLNDLFLQNADCVPKYTRHVDSFLFDNDLLHELTAQGRIESHYCVECGSTKTKSLSKESFPPFFYHNYSLPMWAKFWKFVFCSLYISFCITSSNSIHVQCLTSSYRGRQSFTGCGISSGTNFVWSKASLSKFVELGFGSICNVFCNLMMTTCYRHICTQMSGKYMELKWIVNCAECKERLSWSMASRSA